MKRLLASLIIILMILATYSTAMASDSAMTRGEFAKYYVSQTRTNEQIQKSIEIFTGMQVGLSMFDLFAGKDYQTEYTTLHGGMFISESRFFRSWGLAGRYDYDQFGGNHPMFNSLPEDNVGDKTITKSEVLFTLARDLYLDEYWGTIGQYNNFLSSDGKDAFKPLSIVNIDTSDRVTLKSVQSPIGKDGTIVVTDPTVLGFQPTQHDKLDAKWVVDQTDIFKRSDLVYADSSIVNGKNGVMDEYILSPRNISHEKNATNVLNNQTGGKVWYEIYAAAKVLQSQGISVVDSDGNVNWTRTMSRAEVEELVGRALAKKGRAPANPAPTPTPPTQSTDKNVYIGDPNKTTNSSPYKVTINGTEVRFPDQTPASVNGSILVPVASVANMLGATVKWDGATQTATIIKDGKTINLVVDSATAFVNGSPLALDTPAIIINNRTMVPVRFIAEAFDMNVEWANSTVIITSK